MKKYLYSINLEEELQNCKDKNIAESIIELKSKFNEDYWYKGIKFIHEDEFKDDNNKFLYDKIEFQFEYYFYEEY